MLKLRSSSASPFGRKVKVAALFTGHADRMEILVSDTMNPNDPLRKDNPLGKIPCLVLEDGSTVYDSRVIVEYLDHLAGGGIVIPKEWPARLHALKLQALADGIMDAAILRFYEGRFRSAEKHEPAWLLHQTGKMERGLALIEAAPPMATAKPDIGVITLACALDWLDFRFQIFADGGYPKLRAFLDDFARLVPDFSRTKPHM